MENMESKSKYRTLGILVIIAAAILLLILFENKSKPDTNVTKAPPFPDQAVQVVAPRESTSELPSPVEQTDSTKSQSVDNTPADTSKGATVQSSDNTSLPEPENTIKMNRPSVINSPLSPTDSKNNDNNTPKNQTANLLTDDPSKNVNDDDDFKSSKQTTTPLVKKVVHVSKEKTIKKLPVLAYKQKSSQDNLIKFKNAVWVIQLGSFKHKENALRLVNRLRANGYKAFIRKTATAFGEHNNVLVGPVVKKDKAHAVANRLKNDLHMEGIVISYKPLEL